MKPQPPDMSPRAVTHRLRRVAELVRVCRALAGPRRRPATTPAQPALPNWLGTAPAAGAVFRALAENRIGTDSCGPFQTGVRAAGQDARAHPATPAGGCAPQPRSSDSTPNPEPATTPEHPRTSARATFQPEPLITTP